MRERHVAFTVALEAPRLPSSQLVQADPADGLVQHHGLPLPLVRLRFLRQAAQGKTQGPAPIGTKPLGKGLKETT